MSAQPKPSPITQGHVAIISLLVRQGVASHLQTKKGEQRDRHHLRTV
jgi:hypothetical protein